MVENRPGTVYIERRAEFVRRLLRVDLFAMKLAVAVMERVHFGKMQRLI